MATLNDTERKDVWAGFMQDLSRDRAPLGLSKTELRAAVDALDDFMSANAAAINGAIPQPARAALGTAQKARLLSAVVLRRYATGA